MLVTSCLRQSISTTQPIRILFSGTKRPYDFYTRRQIKESAMPEGHANLYQRLVNWANTGLQQSDGGKRCGFSRALKEGSVEFAVFNATGNYRTDYMALSTSLGNIIRNRFPILTQQRATILGKKCLVIAVPGYSNPDETTRLKFLSMQNEVRGDHYSESLKRGLLSIGFLNSGNTPPQFTTPFPLIAVRYLVPTDKPLIERMQNPYVALQRFRQVYPESS